jgi:hypothetical protein
MTAKARKPLLVNLTWAAVALMGLAMVYVLSYAPVVWWRPERPGTPSSMAANYRSISLSIG